MYGAKASGKAQYVVYATRMDEHLGDRLELVADLRRAGIAEEFVLHYEPVVDLATERCSASRRSSAGATRLAACSSQSSSFLSPRRPVESSTSGAGCWPRRAGRPRPGRRSFLVPGDVGERQCLDSAGAATRAARRRRGRIAGLRPCAAALTLEITETVLARRRQEMTTILEEVTSRGVRLALDDFGTGYSSLRHCETSRCTHSRSIARSFTASEQRAPRGVRAGHRRARRGARPHCCRRRYRGGWPGGCLEACRLSHGTGIPLAGPLPPVELESFVRAELGRSAARDLRGGADPASATRVQIRTRRAMTRWPASTPRRHRALFPRGRR